MIYEKISQIISEVSTMEKMRREEIVPKMLPLLAKYKIAIKPLEISDYHYKDDEASFIAKYELVDTEDSNLTSIIAQLPAGGCDSDKKGRATYMASTGVYRQLFQQIFAIPIIEDNIIENSNNQEDDLQPDFFDSNVINSEPSNLEENKNKILDFPDVEFDQELKEFLN